MDNRKFLPYVIGVIAIAVIALILSNSTFLTIKAGEAGVLFKKFGGGLEKETIYGQGFHVVAPWNTMYIYNVKEQTAEESMNVLDKNGLSITVDVTVRFNPFKEKIGYVHERFGKDYTSILVIPEVRSAVRQVMGRYSAEEIYSTKRAEVETNIINEAESSLSSPKNNIQMNALLIREVVLPENIKKAIEMKLGQEQEFLAYQFKLEKEKKEAERKRIAAEGEAKANEIINNSLTNNLLKMRGIEATSDLANSTNAKIIVIGSGKDGMPLILGNN
ncbi:MAG: prohibitin family protein [Cyclobacteriaceae bacterium]|nr:prohibitin family protein [Cyclobacteriaceae bacterium]